jgi:hypothetical protein
MKRVTIHWLADPKRKVWVWFAAGVLVAGLAGANREQQAPQRPSAGWNARAGWNAPRGWSAPAGPANGGYGAAEPGGWSAPQDGWQAPAVDSGMAAPQSGWSAPAAAGGEETALPSGDSVSDRVNNNFSDYMRDQQRVVSENDGQTYIVESGADPNGIVDTRDGVSGFSAATPGSDAAGYGSVDTSGATTVDTSTATPVDTSSSTTAAE